VLLNSASTFHILIYLGIISYRRLELEIDLKNFFNAMMLSIVDIYRE